jgi:dual specificity protein kinase YAK1
MSSRLSHASAFRRKRQGTSTAKSGAASSGVNVLRSLTIDVAATFAKCDPHFRIVQKVPKRILTLPSEGVSNHGMDNSEGNLVCSVHDELTGSLDGETYVVLDILWL